MSLKEELSQRMQNRDDQFLTFVYTANTDAIAPKLRSDKNHQSESIVDFNAWEFLSNLEQGRDSTTGTQALPMPRVELTKSKRSSSFHCITEHDNLQNSQEWNHRCVGRARSFHTVEEFDAIMVQRSSLSDAKLQVYESQHIKDEISLEKTPIMPSSQLHNELKAGEESPQEGNISEKGSKRKKIAKALDSLEIPHTVEFCTIASLKEWLHSGGAYITPKFGSYSLPSSGTRANECNECAIFSPELVAAFEERMQQLEAEAESVLKQISEKKCAQDEILSNITRGLSK
ncbi:uncharacterized protein LOC105642117 [Jatropha curcas]|nr:uncharacterized protein LOC105642117 [Jatropha curcas]